MKKKLLLALACIAFVGAVVFGVNVVKQNQKENAQKEKVLQEQQSRKQAKENESLTKELEETKAALKELENKLKDESSSREAMELSLKATLERYQEAMNQVE